MATCFTCGSPAEYVGLNKVENCSNDKCQWRERIYAWVSPKKLPTVIYADAAGAEVYCYCISHSKDQPFGSFPNVLGLVCVGEVVKWLGPARYSPKG